MLNIQLPHIAVQKVSNGFVVQWRQKNPNTNQSERTRCVEAVCMDGQALLAAIELAAADVSAIDG